MPVLAEGPKSRGVACRRSWEELFGRGVGVNECAHFVTGPGLEPGLIGLCFVGRVLSGPVPFLIVIEAFE